MPNLSHQVGTRLPPRGTSGQVKPTPTVDHGFIEGAHTFLTSCIIPHVPRYNKKSGDEPAKPKTNLMFPGIPSQVFDYTICETF